MKTNVPRLHRGLIMCGAVLTLALYLPRWLAAQEATNQEPVAVESAPVHHHEIVQFGQDVTLGKNEIAPNIVVLFADATIDGTVEENVVVIGGQARINGKVEGSLVVIMGDATVGPNAVLEAEAVIVGGRLQADPSARIEGQRVELGFLRIPGFKQVRQWLADGLMLARPLPPGSPLMWAITGLFLLLYLLLNLIFPHPIQLSVTALENRPVAAFGLGLLTLVLFGPLTFLLLVSMVGLLIIPFLVCALAGCLLLGKVAVFRYLGHQLGRQFGAGILQSPFPALLVGAVLVFLLYTVPVLGFLVWGITTPLGLGAVACAAFGLLERQERKPMPPPPGSANPIPPAPLTLADAPASTVVGDISSFSRAGFWVRLTATFLDLLLVGFVMFLLGLPSPGIVCLAWMAYHIGMWAWRSTTIGGIILGLKIVRLDGQPVTFAVALVRSLASFLSALLLFVGFFWAGWDAERQSWHDKIAGTTIVRLPKGTPLILV